MVEVDRISLQDVDAVGCGRVDVLIDLSGIEWRVVVVADGDGDGVCGRWLEAPSSAHQVLREGCLCVVIEMESSPSGAASVGPVAAASAASCNGAGVIIAIVRGRHCCCSIRDMSSGVEFV